jgi:RES domain-containing protein
MDLWRLYRKAHGPGLDGAGGLYAAGRWHVLGRPVVYFGASAAIVVLEKLAHIDPQVLPSDLILARFEAEIAIDELADPSILHDLEKTRARGEIFFESKAASLLRVPSVVLPEEFNLVMNPLHPDAARIRTVSQRLFLFNHRLLPANLGKTDEG